MPRYRRTDIISTIANVGAPLLVCALLVHRIATGQWASVVFTTLIFAGVHASYVMWLTTHNPAGETENGTDSENDGSAPKS
ncbi:MAG: hypothetical protein WD066_17910 [Planctomycetaceae bacterium]